jgi:hypothetical protein
MRKTDRKYFDERMATAMIPLMEAPGADIWIIESLGLMGSNARSAVRTSISTLDRDSDPDLEN